MNFCSQGIHFITTCHKILDKHEWVTLAYLVKINLRKKGAL